MTKFKCTICGYTYNEGMPQNGIAPGTKWEDVSQDFACPLCGAPKAAFEELKEDNSLAANQEVVNDGEFENLGELTAGELSALCSNLAKGCEKQHLVEEMDLFNQLANYYKGKVEGQSEKNFDHVSKRLKVDLSEDYAKANSVATAKADRGALRALVWSEKVSRMLNSLLDRYDKEGDAMFENTKIYVCDICGFIYVGNNLPEVCPVCKVPNFRISQVERG